MAGFARLHDGAASNCLINSETFGYLARVELALEAEVELEQAGRESVVIALHDNDGVQPLPDAVVEGVSTSVVTEWAARLATMKLSSLLW